MILEIIICFLVALYCIFAIKSDDEEITAFMKRVYFFLLGVSIVQVIRVSFIYLLT